MRFRFQVEDMTAFPCDTVVVPMDFSEESENALKVALEMTGDPTKIHVVNVLPPLEAISPAVIWGELSDEHRVQSVKKYADTYLEARQAAGASVDVLIGSPGHEVTEFAKRLRADLIIVSSHGYHGIKRMLLGSVAEAIIRHAHCAVLVLRRQDAE